MFSFVKLVIKCDFVITGACWVTELFLLELIYVT